MNRNHEEEHEGKEFGERKTECRALCPEARERLMKDSFTRQLREMLAQAVVVSCSDAILT